MKCPECGHEFEDFDEDDAIAILKKILDKLERPVYIWPETTTVPTYLPAHGPFTGDPLPPQGETWCGSPPPDAGADDGTWKIRRW